MVVRKLRPEILQHPNIPKPLHGLTPRTIYGQAWWDEVRRAAYRSTAYHCLACGVSRFRAKYCKHMEAHELYKYDYDKGTITYLIAVPLCHSCHSFIHSGRMRALVIEGLMPQTKMIDILNHGQRVLSAAGLVRPADPDCSVRWEDWRMILDGIPSVPLWPTHEAWSEHYSRL